MRYLMLIHSNPVNWNHPMFLHQDEELTAEERDARLRQFSDTFNEITASGELVFSAALAAPADGKIVRIRDQMLAITDGPYAETKEQLAGIFMLECESWERAVEIARRFPDARLTSIELRPVLDPCTWIV